MVRESEIRRGEVAVTPPPPADASLVFIGRIHSPWTSRMESPRQGRADVPYRGVRAWVVGIEGAMSLVRGLDCLDGTPLLDLKPDRAAFVPLATAQAGDFQVGEAS